MNKRVINGSISMRVIFTEHVTDDFSALTCSAVTPQSELIHRIQDSAVNRFQTVAYIRQCTACNNGHRIVYICLLNFRINRYTD